MAPNNNLIATFAAAISAFNNAKQSTNYNDFKPYLNEPVYIDKVDDAVPPVQASPNDIVNYLNNYQVGNFPQFAYDGPHDKEHTTNKGVTMGEVIGTGTYWDTYAHYQNDQNPANPKKGVPVHYTLRFILNGGVYLLSRALVVPI
jgi:hypothetical protein